MTAFSFDAKAALHQAQKSRGLPTLPTLPTDGCERGAKVGTVGTVGTVRASDPEMTPAELARDFYEERASIREFDGGQDRETAEREAWGETRREAETPSHDEMMTPRKERPMTPESTRDEIRDHLFQKLVETAERIRQGGAMTDHQVTCAFLGVGVTLAQHCHGPVGVAEWLRDVADEIERGEAGLHGKLQ